MLLIGYKPRFATVISALSSIFLEIKQEQFQAQLSISSVRPCWLFMKTFADRARYNLKIFKTQDSGTDSTNKVQYQEKLEEQMKYLMQEAGFLTSREADVARLICDGLIDRGIAERLGLSHHMVKDYLNIIYVEFPVHIRAQLVSSMFQ
jgi:DNA-binding CsgD family transcriptional regulator